MAQKIIIDADPGIGDALAILVSLVDPSLDVLGLTATAGSVSGLQATRNLQYLTDLVDPPKHPRVSQSELPPAQGPPTASTVPTRHSFHGTHGLGDVVVNVPDLHNRRESAKLIVDLVREFPHEVKLLTLGPLTNAAAAFDLDPELSSLLEGIVCLGGTNSACGDVTSVAEFNIWADPESARAVFQQQVSRILVPLDVTSGVALTFEDVDVLTDLIQETKNGEPISSMLQFAIRANRQQLACEGIALHSVVALAIAAKAEAFTLESVQADVETSGELTRGMTVIDRRRINSSQTNLELVTSVDDLGIIDYFSRSLRRAAG
ncbi:MAG: nucleoside hydrolase [Planctomycetaceae bacterium]